MEPPDPEDEDGMEYYETVSHPMDLATILARVDARMYSTPAAYLADMALVLRCMQQLHGVPAAPPLPQPVLVSNLATADTAGAAAAGGGSDAAGMAGAAVGGGVGGGVVVGHGEEVLVDAGVNGVGEAAAGGGAGGSGLLLGEAATARSSPIAAAAAAAGGSNGTSAAGGAAAGDGAQQQQQQQQGPAHREVSRAQGLLDEATELVRQRVWPELVAKCEGIVAKGGPAPAPPGVLLPEHLLPPLPPATAGGGAGGRGGRADGEGELGRGGAHVPPRVTR